MSSIESSNFDIDFSIPYVAETPTLDEILAENHDNIFEEIDHLIEQDFGQLGEDTLEYSETELLDTSLANQSLPDNSNVQIESSFNVAELTFIKTQLSQSKSDQIDSGNPTAFALSPKFLAIGTFHGHVLLFELGNDKIVAFLKHNKEFGSISSVTINRESTRLVAGGSRGSISLWNLISYEMLRVINDLNGLYSSILSISYLSNDHFVVLNDTSGSIFIMDVRKKNSRLQCVFSGSRGEALVLKPLTYDDIPHDQPEFNGIEQICLLAMATVSKMIVISLRPSVVVHFTTTLRSTHLEYLPLIAWNLSFKYGNECMPLLTFGRQNQIFIHRMVTDFVEKITFIPLYQFTTTNYMLQHLSWFEDDKLFVVDTDEIGHLIDVIVQEEMEKIDLSHIELVYENAHFKSLANGGYVSQAMSQAGEHACNNSIYLRILNDESNRKKKKNQLYILGIRSMFVVTLRNWEEKVNHLIFDCQNYGEALQFLYDQYELYNDRQNSDVENVIDRVIEMMNTTLISYIQQLEPKNIKQNEDATRELIINLIKYIICLKSDQRQMVIFKLFEQINSNLMMKSIFIESLEPHIFDDQLSSLNPVIVKEMIDYFIGKEWYNLLDSLIIHLNIESLDIDHIIRIYSQYYLYDSFIYIYNCAMQDFITPFNELLKLLRNSIQTKSQLFPKTDIIIGNKLLVYLNCMLTCTYYPNKGSLPESQQQDHLETCFQRLMAVNDDNRLDIIDVLFQYDSIEFLNTLLIGFDYLDNYHPNLCYFKQMIIDKMLAFIVETNITDLDDDHRNSFFIFLGRCCISNQSSSQNSIKLIKDHFNQMIDSLFKASSNKRFEERQQILIQLFRNAPWNQWLNEQNFLEKAQTSRMYKICEQIYSDRRDWINLFRLHVEDPSKHEEIFNFIDLIIKQDDSFFNSQNFIENCNKSDFLNIVFEHFRFLVQIDHQKSSQIFYQFVEQCEGLFNLIIDQLETEPYHKYQFLRQIMIDDNQTNNDETNVANKSKILEQICNDGKNQDIFLELCLQFEPEQIVLMLELLKNYDQMKMLEICHELQSYDGQAFILESMKQYSKSFDVLFDQFKKTLDDILKMDGMLVNIDDGEQLIKNFQKILSFCDRRHDPSKPEMYWLELLEYLIFVKSDCHQQQKSSTKSRRPNETNDKIDLNKLLNQLFETFMSEMLTHLNLVLFLDIIMEKILKQSDTICDFREMLLCILENYNYEKTLLELTTNILSSEHRQLIEQFRRLKLRSKIFRRSMIHCELCDNNDDDDVNIDVNEKLITFNNCDHILHWSCLQRFADQTKCPACHIKLNHNYDKNFHRHQKIQYQPIFNDIQLRILNQIHHGRLKSWIQKQKPTSSSKSINQRTLSPIK
ncbi:vacuolar protein sorting 8 [Dermatophagoides pteronyssinus]|uniref:vacuolar protein sorting 8 n=1 Tax=Dermatophagoides pteronyssinus TaxID=6956 RepID=UPI003F67FA6E